MPRRVYSNLKAFFEAQRDLKDGLSAQDVAKKLGISYAYLSMIKWGDRQPDLKLALAISHLCHVPVESLLRRDRKKAS